MKRRVLVTGAGGIGGVNFVRALRYTDKYFIAGTDYNQYHLVFPELDKRYRTPRHDHPKFVPTIKRIIKEDSIEFVYPQPTVEALVLVNRKAEISAKTFLPERRAMEMGFDKLATIKMLQERGVTVPKTVTFDDEKRVDWEGLVDELGSPIWLRVRQGAGGKLSLPCRDSSEIRLWMNLWINRGETRLSDWIAQEYIGGRDVAWDSLWFGGKLVTSYARERLEYPFRHMLPSGVGGTPTVSRIIWDESLNEIGEKSVLALDKRPHGFYCLDFKYREKPYVTEINVGKAHTTLALWSYSIVKELKLPWHANLPDLYVQIGLNNEIPDEVAQRNNLFPEGYYLLRHMDCGVFLWREDGWLRRVL